MEKFQLKVALSVSDDLDNETWLCWFVVVSKFQIMKKQK